MQFADCGRDRGKRGAAGDRPSTGQRGGLVHPAVDPGFDGGRLVGEIDDRTNDSGGGQRVELVDQRGDVDGVDGTADRDQSQAATWSDLPRLHGQSAAGAGVQIDGHGCLAGQLHRISRELPGCVGEVDQHQLGGQEPCSGGPVVRRAQECGLDHRHDLTLGRIDRNHRFAGFPQLLQFHLECLNSLKQFLQQCPIACGRLWFRSRWSLVLGQSGG